MLFDYFKDFDKKIIKKGTTKKAAAKKTAAKKGASAKKAAKKKAPASSVKLDIKAFAEGFEKIIPSHLSITDARPVDANGFSPDGVDLCVYQPVCRDIVNVMGGFVPHELLQATLFTVPELNKKTLQESLNRVVAAKKINRLAPDESPDAEIFGVPAFVVAGTTSYKLMDLKNDILNFYMNNNVAEFLEFEILVILDTGIVVKNWREKTYTVLETKEDTMMWFFILMTEYLEAERNSELDFRKYVKSEKTYEQY